MTLIPMFLHYRTFYRLELGLEHRGTSKRIQYPREKGCSLPVRVSFSGGDERLHHRLLPSAPLTPSMTTVYYNHTGDWVNTRL